MPQILNSNDTDFDHRFSALLERSRSSHTEIGPVVSDIIKSIRQEGFPAVAALTKKFDKLEVDECSVAVTVSDVERAMSSCDAEDIAALRFAADRIRLFHEKQLPEDTLYQDEEGMTLGWRWTPVQRAGLMHQEAWHPILRVCL